MKMPQQIEMDGELQYLLEQIAIGEKSYEKPASIFDNKEYQRQVDKDLGF